MSSGRAAWWAEEAQRARDDAIRELADQHFGSLDLNGQANAVLHAIRSTSPWDASSSATGSGKPTRRTGGERRKESSPMVVPSFSLISGTRFGKIIRALTKAQRNEVEWLASSALLLISSQVVR